MPEPVALPAPPLSELSPFSIAVPTWANVDVDAAVPEVVVEEAAGVCAFVSIELQMNKASTNRTTLFNVLSVVGLMVGAASVAPRPTKWREYFKKGSVKQNMDNDQSTMTTYYLICEIAALSAAFCAACLASS